MPSFFAELHNFSAIFHHYFWHVILAWTSFCFFELIFSVFYIVTGSLLLMFHFGWHWLNSVLFSFLHHSSLFLLHSILYFFFGRLSIVEDKINHTHLLFLQPSNTPGLVLILIQLTGSENYGLLSWSVCLALKTNRKLGFIIGICTKASFRDALHEEWKTNSFESP